MENIDSNISSEEELVGIDEVQKFLNRSRASVYRYTNTDFALPASSPHKKAGARIQVALFQWLQHLGSHRLVIVG